MDRAVEKPKHVHYPQHEYGAPRELTVGHAHADPMPISSAASAMNENEETSRAHAGRGHAFGRRNAMKYLRPALSQRRVRDPFPSRPTLYPIRL